MNNARHIFVYGTLMQAAAGALGKAERERLARESRNLGSAEMHGAALYDLGRYPGLRESADLRDVVHGEVVELLHPEPTLAWLDAYEGLGSPDCEYLRAEREVVLADGQRRTAWVYLFQRDAVGRQRIDGGRWVVRA